ncbi:MAG: cytochrome C [Alphaproteobacteria bacterium]|nr:cytochrome C [Alphaproteobacteria bacterium]
MRRIRSCSRHRPPAAIRIAAGALLAVLAAAPGAQAQQAAAPPGASACSGCHAPASRPSTIPTLEGRTPDDIVAAMQAFRNGTRHATVMDRIAKGFADSELAAVAAYVAGGGR